MATPPEDQELRNVIDKLAQFVARNGPEFEKMTMEKQKENPKFSFLFGGDFFGYYKYKLAVEQQQLLCKQPGQDGPDAPPPMNTLPPPPVPAPPMATPSVDELIQQSQWNLQHQEQHLQNLRQEQVTAAVALALEQQTQKLQHETQLDVSEFDGLLQPIIDTCTKDAISAGKNWMFSNAKSPQHCELMAGHLRNRVTASGAPFQLRLHLIYLINDVLHHCQRKQQRDLLAALQKVVVPIYCTSFLAVEEDKQQKIARLLQLWEKNGYFDETTIQQLQSPALGLGQYQASLITEYAAVVQPVQTAFQQQIQALQAQHQELVASLRQSPAPAQPQPQPQPSPVPAPVVQAPAGEREAPAPTTQHGEVKGDYEVGRNPLPATAPPREPGDAIPAPKPGWFDPQRNLSAWPQQQPPPFDPTQPPPPCPPWAGHEAPWSEQRNPNWGGQRENAPWSEQRENAPWAGQPEPPPPPPAWSGQREAPWSGQPERPPWGQREPPFRMQRPPPFRGPPPPFNQPPPPHDFGRFPPRFMQDDLPPRHHFEPPPYPPPGFEYQQGDFPSDLGPPPHPPPSHRIPPPGMTEPPPWGGSQHPEFGPPPPRGFNGQAPHGRRQAPSHVSQDDPSLVPNVPYFDLPAGLMAPLIKLEDHDYKALDPKDIRLPPPMPPSDRLLAAVEAFYSPPSHERPRNSEGWEQNGLYEFFRAKMRARRKRAQEDRSSARGSRSRSRGRSSSRSSSRSKSRSRSRSRSYSRSRSRSGSRSGSRSSRSRSRSRSHSRSRSRSGSPSRRRRARSRTASPPSTSGLGSTSEQRLGEENKGHRMLRKMGWSGSGGLGAKEQGIRDPVKEGDVRDKWDQYKGVGVSLDDPYENYRRNKSHTFIARMMAREDVNRDPQQSSAPQ
ncbi:calcium homeostasis endoplasmic reticulum protein isoform X2 [Paramormyrops kingsleyae]|uniref:Calcium homeostasis endoplasmic reticulum protein n=1 Tax=Paramormyrops kingsleyae TaxID=1676925 RepID=A0A3B3R4A6_9TELE|nr:calcium homeostasis endoplasmic reticulum protein isoform X2 [Paramormyrops kingsleyae]